MSEENSSATSEIPVEKVQIIGVRWSQSPVEPTVLGMVMAQNDVLQRFVIAKTCVKDKTPDETVDLIVATGARIYKSDAEMMLQFLNGVSVDDMEKHAHKCTHTIDFFRWSIWLCELMHQPVSYGTFIVANPAWKLLFESNVSPNEAFEGGKDVGAIIQKEDRWIVDDEQTTVDAIGITPDDLEKVWNEGNPDVKPPF